MNIVENESHRERAHRIEFEKSKPDDLYTLSIVANVEVRCWNELVNEAYASYPRESRTGGTAFLWEFANPGQPPFYRRPQRPANSKLPTQR